MHFVTKHKHWLLTALGTIVWSLTMVKSGLRYKYGLGFWGANGHDGIWHLALIEGLARGGWQMPIFAGEAIKNYHIGFDLLLAVVHRLTGISSSLLYFQLTPPLLALAVGWLTYKFVTRWTKSEVAGLWALFFVYFGGSLGWLVGHGESTFWSTQAISTLVNPPFAMSLVAILLGIVCLQKRKWWLAGIILGLSFQIKVYGGLLAWSGLLTAAIWTRQKDLWKTWVATTLVGGGLLALTAPASTKLLVWQPGWYLETMMGLSDRVNWPRFYSAMINYRLSKDWIKAVPAYLVALAIFWIGNMGTRILKESLVVTYLKKWHSLGWEEIFMATVIIGGGLIPMFFLQQGTPWNTIQFLYYSLFFSGILAAVAMARLKNKLVMAIVVGLTLPTTWQSLKIYLPSRPPAKLANEEIQALQFLAQQPLGVVLTYPYDPNAAKAAEANPPRPLYLYDSTAYVAAFSRHPVYLEDEVNLNITGFDWQSRRGLSEQFFKLTDAQQAKDFLRVSSIKYIYLSNIANNRPILSDSQVDMQNIFENSQAAIWKVK